MANGVLPLLAATLSNEAFLSWGWRVPFLLSGLLVIVLNYLGVRIAIDVGGTFTDAVAVERSGAAGAEVGATR